MAWMRTDSDCEASNLKTTETPLCESNTGATVIECSLIKATRSCSTSSTFSSCKHNHIYSRVNSEKSSPATSTDAECVFDPFKTRSFCIWYYYCDIFILVKCLNFRINFLVWENFCWTEGKQFQHLVISLAIAIVILVLKTRLCTFNSIIEENLYIIHYVQYYVLDSI